MNSRKHVHIWLAVTAGLLSGGCQDILGIPDNQAFYDGGVVDALDAAGPVEDAPGNDFDAPNCLPRPAGMVAWWDGDTPGQPGRDLLGSYSAISSVGFPTQVVGKVGDAIQFTENDLLFFSTTPQPSSFTLEGWVRVAVNESNWLGIYGKYGEASLCTYNNGLTYWDADEGGGTDGNLAQTDPGLLDDNWHHIAVTWDQSILRTYIDGEFETSEATTEDVALPEPAEMGGLSNNGTLVDRFAGLIDEFSVYDRVLSSDEIQAIYTADAYGKCKP